MRLLGAALLALLPLQAAALSCLAPMPQDLYARAAEAPQTYFAVAGTLRFDPALLPEGLPAPDGPQPPALTEVPGRIEGMGLGPGGFQHPFAADVTLDVTCAGPWCGSLTGRDELLAFLRQDADGSLHLELGPCGPFGIRNPHASVLDTVAACFAAGGCPE